MHLNDVDDRNLQALLSLAQALAFESCPSGEPGDAESQLEILRGKALTLVTDLNEAAKRTRPSRTPIPELLTSTRLAQAGIR